MMPYWLYRSLAREQAYNAKALEANKAVNASMRAHYELPKPVPVALKFDVMLTEEDRIRLHALGVEA